MRSWLLVACVALSPFPQSSIAQRAPTALIDAKNDHEYWKNPAFYRQMRVCAGKSFGMERTDNQRFSDTLHRCYRKITNDKTYWYYNQAAVETCYRRQHQADCKMRAR